MIALPKTILRAIEATREDMRRIQFDMRDTTERAEETLLCTRRIKVMRELLASYER